MATKSGGQSSIASRADCLMSVDDLELAQLRLEVEVITAFCGGCLHVGRYFYRRGCGRNSLRGLLKKLIREYDRRPGR